MKLNSSTNISAFNSMHYKTNTASLWSDLSWQDKKLVQQDSELTVVDSLFVPKVHIEHVHQFTAGQVGDDRAVKEVIRGELTATNHVCQTKIIGKCRNLQTELESLTHNWIDINLHPIFLQVMKQHTPFPTNY